MGDMKAFERECERIATHQEHALEPRAIAADEADVALDVFHR